MPREPKITIPRVECAQCHRTTADLYAPQVDGQTLCRPCAKKAGKAEAKGD